jgi:hypothetical protein
MHLGKSKIRILLLFFFCHVGMAQATTYSSDSFFKNLSRLCGQKFTGAAIFPTTAEDPFFGKVLKAKISSCSATEIRIPFQVGEDSSRTWILTKTKQGLQLKHDHRHPDGTPDTQTNYGGMANQNGNAYMQYFEADTETAKLIPAAATNVWKIHLSEDAQSLTYYLERNGKRRFWAVLAANP